MPFGLRELWDPQYISEAYVKESGEVDQNPLRQFFEVPAVTEQRDGDQVEVSIFPASMKPAPLNKAHAPAHVLQQSGADKKWFTPLKAFNQVTIPQEAVEFLRQADNPAAMDRGKQEIKRQFRDFGLRHMQLRNVALAKALTEGVIYVNENDEIVETSGDAVQTIDLQVPAGHKDQLDYDGGGDIINVAWDNASANILQDLEQIGRAARVQNAPKPRNVIMNSTAKQWFRDNTEFATYLPNANFPGDKLFHGSLMEVGDYRFMFIDSTYEDVDGNTQYLIPTDKAIIVPDPGPWFKYLQTSQTIAKRGASLGVVGSTIDDVMSNTEVVYGMYAYAALSSIDPLKYSLFMGDNFLYAFTNPQAIWMATVDF